MRAAQPSPAGRGAAAQHPLHPPRHRCPRLCRARLSPGATGGAQPPRPEADPVLLTGDWRSRCPASRSSALGSCAAGLMLGIDRGSQCPVRIRAGSSTRTRKERAAFLQERGFPTASPFPSHTARQAQGHAALPRPGSRRDPAARRSPGSGERGAGVPGTGDGRSGCQREAPTLGKPSPGGCGCCPRRGSGASAARCSQGAHSAPDAFSNLARLARLRQRGRGASALTLARPRGRPRCRGAPSRAGRAALPRDTEPAGLRLAPGTAGSAPRAGRARGAQSPPKPITDTQQNP